MSYNVFLGWAGERSGAVAKAIKDWLPGMLQAARPWMSTTDIDKGAAWDNELTKALSEIAVGVLVVTPENQNSAWLNYEAGVLASKLKTEAHVCTFLFDLKPSDITGPLSRFQHTTIDPNDFLLLINTLNNAIGGPDLSEAVIRDQFKRCWSELETRLKKIPEVAGQPDHRTDRDIMEEILNIVRYITGRKRRKTLADFWPPEDENCPDCQNSTTKALMLESGHSVLLCEACKGLFDRLTPTGKLERIGEYAS